MLDDRGNTAVYLLYAYTRIRQETDYYNIERYRMYKSFRSIARNAQITRDQINEYLEGLGGVLLGHCKEIGLAKHILKFSDCLLTVLENLQLNKMCDYIYELATLFTDFYKDCYVVSKIQSEGKIKIFTPYIPVLL
jgi:arginyl-tRNA synthetase